MRFEDQCWVNEQPTNKILYNDRNFVRYQELIKWALDDIQTFTAGRHWWPYPKLAGSLFYFPKFRRAVVNMAAVLAEKSVLQLSISFPETAILSL